MSPWGIGGGGMEGSLRVGAEGERIGVRRICLSIVIEILEGDRGSVS